jgi:hypothetical protein
MRLARAMRPLCLAAAAALLGLPALAQNDGTKAVGGIYTCKDKYGRTITSDRPIVECAETGQRVLAPDGSTRAVILTPAQERALAEERRRREQEAERAYEQKRKEKILLQRFPNERAWDKVALDQLIEPFNLIAEAQKRIAELQKERKELDAEAEFYQKRKLPAALKRKFDENQIALEAEQRLIETQRAEVRRIQQRLTAELIELRRLWAQQETGG